MDRVASKILLSALLILLGAGKGFAQRQSLLDQKVSVQVRHVTLENGLRAIEEAAHISFSYNPKHLSVDSVVSFSNASEPLGDLIHDLLGNHVEIRLVGTVLILRFPVVKPPEKVYTRIYGSVSDVINGQPLASVSVFNVDGKSYQVSDSNGSYSIAISSRSPEVEISYNLKEYRDTVVVFSSGQEVRHDVALKPRYLDSLPTGIEPKELQGLDSNLEKVAIVKALVPKPYRVAADNFYGYYESYPYQISVLPFIGTSGRQNALRVNRFSFNVFAGYAAGVDGVEIGGFANVNRHNVRGVQIAGFVNANGGTTEGFQMAGYTNITGDRMKGVQLSGFVNTVGRSMIGTQIAGFVNIDGGMMKGTQLAGFVNAVGRETIGTQIAGFVNVNGGSSEGLSMAGYVNVNRLDMTGTQISGFVNIAGRSVDGLQLTGFVNLAGKDAKGVQGSGFVNVCGGKMEGTQLTGFVNVAKSVKGVQIGLVNLADSMEGIPIGFVNIIANGLHNLDLATSDLVQLQLQLRLGVEHLYNIYGLGYDHRNRYFSIQYGLGTRWKLFNTKRWSISTEGTIGSLDRNWFSDSTSYFVDLGTDLRFAINDYLAIRGGGGLNWYYNWEGQNVDHLPSLQTIKFDSYIREFWIGYRVGISLKF